MADSWHGAHAMVCFSKKMTFVTLENLISRVWYYNLIVYHSINVENTIFNYIFE